MAVSDSGSFSALPPLKDDQARASAPDGHVWLSASAGTGKTQVLTARVYRLLLRGVDPSAILCLTFTKAGAAEMAGRIGARLAAWVRMPDAQLGSDLIALGEDPTPELRARARTLFAKVLDAPGGGIRIQTIHGFCQSLLAAFPVEAGLTPGFRPIEAREEAVLAREALAELLVEADGQGRTRPIEAVGALSVRLGEGEAEKFLIACARAPKAMARCRGRMTGWRRSCVGNSICRRVMSRRRSSRAAATMRSIATPSRASPPPTGRGGPRPAATTPTLPNAGSRRGRRCGRAC